MIKDEIKLSDHFTYKRLLRFTLPSVIMMIFTSVYGVVDGFFVSRFAGKEAFTAVNFIMPYLMLLGAVGFMFGAGGSALVAKTLGEGKRDKANRTFSLIVYTSIAISVLFTVLGIILLRPVAELLGAEGRLADDCVIYGRIILAALPFFILQCEFQTLFITAEKPKLGLLVTVASGVANIVLDALLVGALSLGLVGAALATAASQIIGGAIPLVYFSRKNSSLLSLTRTSLDFKALVRTCTNGSSELMSNVALSIISMLYNMRLMEYAGEDGVAAYGVLMYVGFIFISIFIGYSTGTAPVVGYHYGAGNKTELSGLLKKSLVLVFSVSLLMLGSSLVLSRPLSMIFVGYDEGLYELTVRGFTFFSFTFLFSGVAFFGSAFFTALNNGLISAVISFLRTLVFQVIAVLLLPLVWGVDGIWLSIVVADLFSALITALFLLCQRKRYGY